MNNPSVAAALLWALTSPEGFQFCRNLVGEEEASSGRCYEEGRVNPASAERPPGEDVGQGYRTVPASALRAALSIKFKDIICHDS